MIKLFRILLLSTMAIGAFVFWIEATMTLNMPTQMADGSSRLLFVIIEMFKIMVGG